MVVQALVDTGADCTFVPLAAARLLGLPAVDEIMIEGVTGAARRVPVHAADVEFGGVRTLARVVPFGNEAILGRDLLNTVVVRLDGPGRTLSFGRRGRRR